MLHVVRRLTLGMTLIVAASAVLLLSDPPRRNPASNDPGAATAGGSPGAHRIVLLQMASQPIMEEGAAGVIDALADHGYVDGRDISLKRLNAEGDAATANTMAQDATGGGYD